MNATRIALELQRSRLKAGLTQEQLAERMGTKQPSISRAESGRLEPSLGFIGRFVQATGVPIDLPLGREVPRATARERRRRLERVMGGYEFNPWTRGPSEAEARSLLADGLTRERFERSETASSRGR